MITVERLESVSMSELGALMSDPRTKSEILETSVDHSFIERKLQLLALEEAGGNVSAESVPSRD
jgi:hypothetical protein